MEIYNCNEYAKLSDLFFGSVGLRSALLEKSASELDGVATYASAKCSGALAHARAIGTLLAAVPDEFRREIDVGALAWGIVHACDNAELTGYIAEYAVRVAKMTPQELQRERRHLEMCESSAAERMKSQ